MAQSYMSYSPGWTVKIFEDGVQMESIFPALATIAVPA